MLLMCLQVESSVKKRAKKYMFSLGLDFRGVVSGCHAQHGECWLFPPLVAAFEGMQKLPDSRSVLTSLVAVAARAPLTRHPQRAHRVVRAVEASGAGDTLATRRRLRAAACGVMRCGRWLQRRASRNRVFVSSRFIPGKSKAWSTLSLQAS